MVIRLEPVADAGVPPVAVQASEYGVVPPDPVAVKVTAVPTAPVVGPLIVTASANGLIVIVAELEAVAELASVTVTDTVWEPLTL